MKLRSLLLLSLALALPRVTTGQPVEPEIPPVEAPSIDLGDPADALGEADPRRLRGPGGGPPCGIPCESVSPGHRCSCKKLKEPSLEPSAIPESVVGRRLLQYLGREAGGTPWHFASATRQQYASVRKMLRDSIELRYFGGLRLIRLIAWNPAAGYPGSVTADLRIVVDRTVPRFEKTSVAWVSRYRANNPLDVDALTDAERAAYVTELVSLIPRRDAWGFTVKKLKKLGPRRYQLLYEPKRPLGPKVGEDILVFDKNGAVLPRGNLFSTDP